MVAPKTRPATKLATKPFPPIQTAPPKLTSASASTTSWSDSGVVQPRRRPHEASRPPPPPSASATRTATPSALTALPIHPEPGDSSLATTATRTVTTGVAMPSLRPLSTFRVVRTRDGTDLLVTTGRLSAASVGARMVATRAASAQVAEGCTRWKATAPRTMVNGRPMASRRSGSPAWRRSCPGPIVDASANSSNASVSSARTRTSGPPGAGLSTSSANGPSSRPARVKTRGPPTDSCSSFPATSAYPIATRPRSTSPSVCMSQRPVPPLEVGRGAAVRARPGLAASRQPSVRPTRSR